MTNYVDPVAANGAVEKWLVQVEDAMLESIRDQSFQWLGEIPEVPSCLLVEFQPINCRYPQRCPQK